MEERRDVRNQDDKEVSVVEQATGADLDNNKHAERDSVCEETVCDGMEDVYAIGFQELVDLNAVNVAIDIRSQARSCFDFSFFFAQGCSPKMT